MVERQTHDRKVAGSITERSGGRVCFFFVFFCVCFCLFVCLFFPSAFLELFSFCWLLFRYPFYPRVSPVARKYLSHSVKSAGGRLQINPNTPLTQRGGSGPTIIFMHTGEPIRETSLHADRQGFLVHRSPSSLSRYRLILCRTECNGWVRVHFKSPHTWGGGDDSSNLSRTIIACNEAAH